MLSEVKSIQSLIRPSLDAFMLHLPQPLLAITPVSSALIVLGSFGVLGRQQLEVINS